MGQDRATGKAVLCPVPCAGAEKSERGLRAQEQGEWLDRLARAHDLREIAERIGSDTATRDEAAGNALPIAPAISLAGMRAQG